MLDRMASEQIASEQLARGARGAPVRERAAARPGPARTPAPLAGPSSPWRALREDARFAYALRHPGGRGGWWARAKVLAGARGLHLLAIRRVGSAALAWGSASGSLRPLRRGARLGAILALRAGEVLFKSSITAGAVIEGGVYLSERGHIIIGPRSMGAGTIVHDHVTIGRGALPEDKPDIGRGVWIGPRCVIFGRIRVGDGATVLPDTVLSVSVPAGAVVQGNPARVVRREADHGALRRGLAAACGSPPGTGAG
ncbi:hypothetical protein AMYX_23560 [Anaeromyxobacter diazotrophicus]|uniref:Serine O-acetyltransferase n=2 Tax=Anaeromyxobacter diazotrophicus TaxID=2590199 RepID=A0A7I9VMH8_9BACT|nr:hypothetical protein AMYX_23560 [Anaeromyxobacter diazotrophicus]